MSHDHVPISPKTDAGVLDDALWRELQTLISKPQSVQQRKSERYPICSKLRLTPIENGKLLFAQAIDVIGKDLSRTGLGFAHQVPCNYRRVAIIFTNTNIGKFAVESQILWTRISPIGHYETGCRFVRKMAGHELRCDN